jgi:gliding motility-associated-like protein
MEMDSLTKDYGSTGDYTVILTAQNGTSGCAPSSDTATIFIRNIAAVQEGAVDFEQCKDQPLMLDGSGSTDVHEDCFRGYTWFFNHPSVRPVTTNEPQVDDVSYPDTGVYQIDLVVEDINGCTDTASYPVIVHEAIASFEADKTLICFPTQVNFTNNSTSTTDIETYMWDFGDQIGMSEEEMPSYTYGFDPGGGSLTVSLNIEDAAGCMGSATQTINLYRPVSQVTTDPFVPNICAGETVNFSATDFTAQGSNLAFNWDFANGTTATTQTGSATYDMGGTYEVVLNFTEIATGCPGNSTVTVNVEDFPVANFSSSVDGQDPICRDQNIVFTDASDQPSPVTSYLWNFGNGSGGTGPQASSFYDKGTFEVNLMVSTAFGCSDETSRSFTLVGPEGDLSVDQGPFCIGDQVNTSVSNLVDVASYSWFFEGQEFGEDEANQVLTISESPTGGQAPVRVNLVGPSGCPLALEDNIAVIVLEANFGTTIAPCDPQVVFLNQSTGGADTYSWDFGDGNTSTASSPGAYVYGSTGSYEVVLTISEQQAGCSDEITQTIDIVSPTPVVGRSLDTCIMAGDQISLPIVNNGSAIFEYNNEIGLSCPAGGNLAICSNPILTPTVDVTYSVTTRDPCFSPQAYEFSIGVFDPNRELVPNAFTPDGDGTNDFFNVILSESGCSQVTEIMDFKVFNRWGQLVYNNDNPTQGWDGAKGGTRQQPDVYIYKIEVRLNDGSERMLSGDVTLIR